MHGSARLSQHGEASEALVITQGFIYETVEDAEEHFMKFCEDEFIYARYGNLPLAIF